MSISFNHVKAASRREPEPAFRILRKTVNERVDLPNRRGTLPGKQPVTKQPIGSGQPESPVRLDGHIEISARGNLLIRHHDVATLLELEQRINRGSPEDPVRATPDAADFFV